MSNGDHMSLNRAIPLPVGVIVIGRNEGVRLQRCLDSMPNTNKDIVYVDSGSQDDSVEGTRARGIEVVELDMSIPFTAARARNEGVNRLLTLNLSLRYVFFVDGDCEIVDGWMEKAFRFMEQRDDVAAVCGWRREKYPESSIYNSLIDLEWQVPAGRTLSCGGDSLMRIAAFRQATGFRDDLICGEEPELCLRLRKLGWTIWCLAEPMTLHDAAIFSIGQWFRRAVRSGYGFANGAALHGGPPERMWIAECRRLWMWGFLFPLTILLLSFAVSAWFMLLFLVYPLRVFRLFLRGKYSRRHNWWNAVSLVVCHFPQFWGQLKYATDRLSRSRSRIIEYK
jgi:glycosyltransferase involved in cell wall biosynthesis